MVNIGGAFVVMTYSSWRFIDFSSQLRSICINGK